MSKEAASSYLGLLWRQYNYELLLVLASLATSLVDSALAAAWLSWRVLPQALLGICLLYFAIRTALIHRSIFPNPVLAYSVCTGKSQEWFESSARRQQEVRLRQSGIRWEAVQREFRVHVSDWAFIDQAALSEDSASWVDLTKRMLAHFWHLPKRVEGVPIYHFFLIAPPTVCFALGAHAGRRVAHVVYHFVNSTKHPYTPVADTTIRDTAHGLDVLNRRIAEDDYSHIVVERQAPASSVGYARIILDFTNHKLSGPFPQSSESEACEIIRVGHKQGIGHLPSEGWERMAQEIATVILECCDRGSKIDLYVNTPVALAFILGTIVGPVKGLTLCEHNIYLQKSIRCFDLTDPLIQGLSSAVAPGAEGVRPGGTHVRRAQQGVAADVASPRS